MEANPKRPTLLVYDPIFKQHRVGRYALELPARCDAISEYLRQQPYYQKLKVLPPVIAEAEQLLACHTGRYLEIVRTDVASERSTLSTGDTDICSESLEIAQLAAGAVCLAVDQVIEGAARNAFCVVRPPGHHATVQAGMGFCLFNNIAIGARHAQRAHGIERVLIVDWDVHHGHGTQDIFDDDPSVFFFSTHQFPLYPGTGSAQERGRGAGLGTTLNIPLPVGTSGAEIIQIYRDRLLPVVDDFQPELVMISAGFDSRVDEPLGELLVTDDDFVTLTELLLDIAARYAQDRLISVLEGGYNLDGLARAAGAHCGALVGAD